MTLKVVQEQQIALSSARMPGAKKETLTLTFLASHSSCMSVAIYAALPYVEHVFASIVANLCSGLHTIDSALRLVV